MEIKIYNESNNPIPKYQTKGASGVDLYANLSESIELKSLERTTIPTGIYIEIPSGYEAQIRARSGLALRHGLALPNGVGTIDSDYRGEIKVLLINLGKESVIINHGERIAQMIFTKYERAEFKLVESKEALEETERDEGGFGHSGV